MSENAGQTAEFSMDAFFGGVEGGFDYQEAFNGAVSDVLIDEAMAREEKVAAVVSILEAADSDDYREFVDMQELMDQIELYCNHDDAFADALESLLSEKADKDKEGKDDDEESPAAKLKKRLEKLRKEREERRRAQAEARKAAAEKRRKAAAEARDERALAAQKARDEATEAAQLPVAYGELDQSDDDEELPVAA